MPKLGDLEDFFSSQSFCAIFQFSGHSVRTRLFLYASVRPSIQLNNLLKYVLT